MKTVFLLFPALAILAGCRPDTAGIEARERGLPLMRQAIEAESQGNFDKAVEFYHESLMANPEAASAHLGLALLLQEHKQDFMAAVYHYQRYLDLQPGSQKEEMVRHKKKITEQFLTQQLVRRHGDAAGVIQQRMVQDIELFKSKITSLEAEKTRLENENNANRTTIKNQATEIERQKRLLDRVVAPAPQQAQQTTPPRRVDIPDISNVKTAPRPPAIPVVPQTTTTPPAPSVAQTGTPSQSGSKTLPPPSPPVAQTSTQSGSKMLPPPSPPPVAQTGGTSSQALAPAPAQPRLHTVQAGETLYRISERYYNDPLKWPHIHEANRQILGPEGRLRVGQVLTIPPLNRPAQ